MSAQDGAINHQVLQVRIQGASLEEFLEDFLLAPSCEAFVDAVPLALGRRQQSPLRATASDLQNGGQEFTAARLRADIDIGAGAKNRKNLCPLGIGHFDWLHSKSLAHFVNTT